VWLRQLGLVATPELWTRGSDLQLGLRGGGAHRRAYIGGLGVESTPKSQRSQDRTQWITTGRSPTRIPAGGGRCTDVRAQCASETERRDDGSRLRLWAGPLVQREGGKEKEAGPRSLAESEKEEGKGGLLRVGLLGR
jgi:hypothetical protein